MITDLSSMNMLMSQFNVDVLYLHANTNKSYILLIKYSMKIIRNSTITKHSLFTASNRNEEQSMS